MNFVSQKTGNVNANDASNGVVVRVARNEARVTSGTAA